jgi:hypothetical protein
MAGQDPLVDQLLEVLRATGQGADRETADTIDAQGLADRKVAALWERLGVNSRSFLSTCATRPAGQRFTLGDLADELDAPIGSVRSWHRNLSGHSATSRSVIQSRPCSISAGPRAGKTSG